MGVFTKRVDHKRTLDFPPIAVGDVVKSVGYISPHCPIGSFGVVRLMMGQYHCEVIFPDACHGTALANLQRITNTNRIFIIENLAKVPDPLKTDFLKVATPKVRRADVTTTDAAILATTCLEFSIISLLTGDANAKAIFDQLHRWLFAPM